MKIYDISQEVFNCNIYDGDPKPTKEKLSSMDDGAICNVTAFYMCCHNGTHIDAPNHFINNGKSIDQIDLQAVVGNAYVTRIDGIINQDDALTIINKAKTFNDSYQRILIKGKAYLSLEASQVLIDNNVLLIGTESQSISTYKTTSLIHNSLLSNEIIILEGLNLNEVNEGSYLLNAAPLNLKDSDGSPCRAILIKDIEEY